MDWSGSSEGMSGSYSTPIKANSRTAAALTSAKEERVLLSLELTPNPNFAEIHLHETDYTHSSDLDAFVDARITEIKAASTERDMYLSLTKLLNRLSKRARFAIQGQSLTNGDFEISSSGDGVLHPALVFVASPNRPPQKDFFGVHVKPDVLATFSTIERLDSLLKVSDKESDGLSTPNQARLEDVSPPPWDEVETAIEVKKKGEAAGQIHHYADALLRYRPDKKNALCLTFNRVGYTFYAVDASRAECSEIHDWKTEVPNLFRFVYSLYLSGTPDPNFSLGKGSHSQYSKWHVTFEKKKYDMTPVFARRGGGRRTWLGIGHEVGQDAPSDGLRILKDAWRDDRRRFEEGALLQKIHTPKYIPGVVRPVAHGPVSGMNVGDAPNTRTKYRLVMGSTGRPLSACRSVLEFLKVMYDVLEAHQNVVERRVLHRDISWYNILCQPRHHNIGPELERPCIASILSEDNPQPYCLLTDFDNAADMDDESSLNELTQRTGTPMFIAADISGGMLLQLTHVSQDINPAPFQLNGETYHRYIAAYGEPDYTAFNDFVASVANKTFPEVKVSEPIIHQPFHDAESIFWTIVWFLMRAWPENSDAEATPVFDMYSTAMLDHRIGKDAAGSRRVIRHLVEEVWRQILHSQCGGLASMLADMGMYLDIKWLRYPTAPQRHAHDALKRLLLKEIVRMTKEGSPIPIQGPRPLLKEHGIASTSTALSKSKRSLTPATLAGHSGSESRKRPRSPSPLSSGTKKPRRISKIASGEEQLEIQQWLQQFREDKKWFQ